MGKKGVHYRNVENLFKALPWKNGNADHGFYQNMTKPLYASVVVLNEETIGINGLR